MTRQHAEITGIVAVALVCTILASYGLAYAGEPSSYWLWHSVLGIIG